MGSGLSLNFRGKSNDAPRMGGRKLSLATPTLAAFGEDNSGQPAPSGDEVDDRLEDAADQSGPTAEKVLDKAADEAREHASMAPVDQPGSFAQEAMEKAGEAEASASPGPTGRR